MQDFIEQKIDSYNLKSFFSSKFEFYSKKKQSKYNILFVDRERVDHFFHHSVLSLALSEKYKMNTIILSDQKKNSFIIRIYKRLGFDKFLSGFNFKKFFFHPLYLFLTCFYSLVVIFNIKKTNFNWFIKKFNINKIFIGDLIYDTYIRYEKRFINPKIDTYFVKILVTSIFRFLIIKNYLISNKVKILIVATETGSRNHGLALRIATKLKIKNYVFFRVNKYGASIISYGSDYFKKGIGVLGKKQLINITKKISYKKINSFYNLRKEFKSENHYTQLDYLKANKTNKKSEKFVNDLKNIKKTKILFASHALADAPHAAGAFVFRDYYEHFIQTLQFVNKNDSENLWIFKQHNNSRELDENTIFKENIKKFKKKNIIICPENVSISSLIKNIDYVVTGRGTIGIEAASEGKKVIICGSAPYTDCGIVFNAKTKKQYFNFLLNINKIKFDKNKIKKLSRKLIYVIENSLHLKTVFTSECKKEKNLCNYFLGATPGFSFFTYNILFSNLNSIFKNNIKNSIFYKKLKDFV
jgi:hypothetical protein